MEDRNDIHYEDDTLDRELNTLVREIKQEEVIRRALIEMLVMLGSDAMLGSHPTSLKRLAVKR